LELLRACSKTSQIALCALAGRTSVPARQCKESRYLHVACIAGVLSSLLVRAMKKKRTLNTHQWAFVLVPSLIVTTGWVDRARGKRAGTKRCIRPGAARLGRTTAARPRTSLFQASADQSQQRQAPGRRLEALDTQEQAVSDKPHHRRERTLSESRRHKDLRVGMPRRQAVVEVDSGMRGTQPAAGSLTGPTAGQAHSGWSNELCVRA